MSERAVLLVDDEPHILNSLRRLLRKEEYRVLTAQGGEEGLAILAENTVQVVVSDYRMPSMDGIEFLQRAKETHPDSVRIVLSGFADAQLIVESINKGEVYRFVPKPWNDEELKATLRQCLDHHDILFQNRELTQRTEEQNKELQRLNEQLEDMVRERTYSLQLAQEILENLPMGIVGISNEAEILLVNSAARQALPCLLGAIPGTEIGTVFASDAARTIEEAMASGAREVPLQLADNGTRYEALLKSLDEAATARGNMLVIYTRST